MPSDATLLFNQEQELNMKIKTKIRAGRDCGGTIGPIVRNPLP